MIVSKTLVWIGLIVGSTIGGFIPELWGAGMFSLAGVIGSTIGGIAGIWFGVKASNWV